MARALLILVAWVVGSTSASAADIPTVLRGAKTITLLPQGGELTITLSKRDLNIYDGEDILVVRLLDSTRETVAVAQIPDDGNANAGGPAATVAQTEIINVTIPVPGPYRLLLAGTGSDLVYGVQTSAPLAVIDGSIMLNDGAVSGEVAFEPPAGAFQIRAWALHNPGQQQMPLLDDAGVELNVFDMSVTGEPQTFDVVAGVGDRSGPWHFDVAAMDIVIEIDGVTTWAVHRDQYFSAQKTRWMVLPYNRTHYVSPGGTVDVPLTLRNSTGVATTFDLAFLCPGNLVCELVEPVSPVAVGADGQESLRVRVTVSGGVGLGSALTGYLVATDTQDSEVVQSVALRVFVDASPVNDAVVTPIVLAPYHHENYQFGYAPSYVENEVYFDRANRPFIRERSTSLHVTTALTLLDGTEWRQRSFLAALQGEYPAFARTEYGGGFAGAKIAFDGDGGAYTAVRVRRTNGSREAALLFTPDAGTSYQVLPFAGEWFDIEQFTGHNQLDRPPPLLGYRQTATHPADFCSYNDLLLYLPARTGDSVALGTPVLVTDNCLGACQHSGGPGSMVTRDGRTHVVWGEVSADGTDPGVPTFVATYDHATGQVSTPVFLAYAPPVDDVHNVPAITIDSTGTLHAVTGAHGQSFQYLHSLAPNDSSAWTAAIPVLDAGYIDDETDADGSGRQTYISLVADPEDTLHIAFRQWRRNADAHFPNQIYAALSVQSRPSAGPWGPARPIVVPAVPGYSIYYHKLTIDRVGNLYLSYNYWTSDTTYQDDFPDRYHHRAVLTSADRGTTWKLVETSDLLAQVLAGADGGPPDGGGPSDGGGGLSDGGDRGDVGDPVVGDTVAAGDPTNVGDPATVGDPSLGDDGTARPTTVRGGCACDSTTPPPILLLAFLARVRRR